MQMALTCVTIVFRPFLHVVVWSGPLDLLIIAKLVDEPQRKVSIGEEPSGFSSRGNRHAAIFLSSDVAEAHQASGHSRSDVLPVARLQDRRATRHAVHHRPLHQLRHRHDAQHGRVRRSLDQTGGGAPLSAQLLKKTFPGSRVFAIVWIGMALSIGLQRSQMLRSQQFVGPNR